MYLKKATHKSGRVYLSIAEGYYDPAKKQTRTVNVQKLGYLDVPAAEYADPLAHFQSVVEKMNAEKQAQRQSLGVTTGYDGTNKPKYA